MARAPILQLSDISLTFGGDPIFDGINMTVNAGDRAALVGRNGSGKSTLMKVMAGLVEPDRGACVVPSGHSVGYMEQDPDLTGFATLGDFATQGLDPGQQYLVERAGAGLKFDPNRPTATASGGERRRAALARLMAQDPDLLLLDEPTNHLDIEAITWLEDELSRNKSAFIIISHDRAFLNRLTRTTFWLDRSVLRRQEIGFGGFEAWRDKIWEEEDIARHKLDRKIKAEAKWAVEGISARRTRNQGRLRALQDLRAERSNMIRRQGGAALAVSSGSTSGKKVIEMTGVGKSFADEAICKSFDLTVQRGDRVAFVGPNGAGKTTLIKLALGQIDPDAGDVKLGTNLEVAVFDQNRAQLDLDASLWENLTDDKTMRVSGKADQVMVRGTPRHVVGYLKDFLFDEAQARAPVRALSGGEKARLLLAKLLAQLCNLLVLDEPTNDLDIETLDLLQELLDDYDGTVLLVSHDRDFIDRVATTTIMGDGAGQWTVYAGGYSDALAQRGEIAAQDAPAKQPVKEPAKQPAPSKAKPKGLSFTQKHRLDVLPDEIAKLEDEIAKLSTLMSDPDLFSKNPDKFHKASAALTQRQAALTAAEEEWLMLEELAENGA